MTTRTELHPTGIALYDPKNFRGLGSGYNNPAILKDAANQMLKLALRRFPNNSLIFIGRGGSGISLATAILLCSEHKHLYNVVSMRKRGFQYALVSTAKSAEESGMSAKIVFVDDYVKTGKTLQRLCKWVEGANLTVDLAIAIRCSPIDHLQNTSTVELASII